MLNDVLWIYVVFAACFGLGMGSFMNVVVYRLYVHKSLGGRSQCPHCQRVLPWYCLVPVVSFILLQAKCHFCKKPIALQYPLVELVTGGLYAVTTIWFITEPWQLVWHLGMMTILVLIFVYDLKYYLIPDVFSLTGIGLAVIGQLAFGMPWWKLALGIAVGGGVFLMQYLISRGRWIGGGDIRLGALLGAYLSWPLIVVGLFFAYVFGATVAVGLLLRSKKQFGDKLPFGTALAAAAIFTVFFGQDIMFWYLYGLLR